MSVLPACGPHICNTHRGQIREWEPPETRVTDDRELPHKWEELNFSSLPVVRTLEGFWWEKCCVPYSKHPAVLSLIALKFSFCFTFKTFDHSELSLLWIYLVLLCLGRLGLILDVPSPTLIMCQVLSHFFFSIFSETHSFPSSFRTSDIQLLLL